MRSAPSRKCKIPTLDAGKMPSCRPKSILLKSEFRQDEKIISIPLDWSERQHLYHNEYEYAASYLSYHTGPLSKLHKDFSSKNISWKIIFMTWWLLSVLKVVLRVPTILQQTTIPKTKKAEILESRLTWNLKNLKKGFFRSDLLFLNGILIFWKSIFVGLSSMSLKWTMQSLYLVVYHILCF